MPPGPMFRIRHPDARALCDNYRSGTGRRSDEEIIAQQIVRIEAAVYAHRPAKQSRALSSASDILYGFNCPQEYGGGMARSLGYNVHAKVHAVDEIDVSVAGRAEHDAR